MIIAELVSPPIGTQVAPFDMTAKGFEYAAANGPFAVFAFVLLAALSFYWWHSERVKTKQSLAKDTLWLEVQKLQEKRVIERDETTRALVTSAIALKQTAEALEQDNMALDALTKAVQNLHGLGTSNAAKLDRVLAIIETRRAR